MGLEFHTFLKDLRLRHTTYTRKLSVLLFIPHSSSYKVERGINPPPKPSILKKFAIITMAKKYEEVYKLKMERQKKGLSQAYEGWEMDQIGGLYNIQNTKALINQNNGMVSIGHWEDGKMDGDPNQFMTVNQMTAALNSQYDNFDLQKAIQDDKSRVGIIDSLKMQYGDEGDLEYLIKTRSQGGKYSKEDEELKLYEQWRDETTKRFMVNEWDVVSVLTDEGLTVNGKAYTFSKDPADKNKEGIIFINTEKSARGIPELTDAQKKANLAKVKAKIDAKNPVIQTPIGPLPKTAKNMKKFPKPTFIDLIKFEIDDNMEDAFILHYKNASNGNAWQSDEYNSKKTKALSNVLSEL